MRTAFLTLIGFATYTLCLGLCPMDMGQMSTMSSEADHSMHMAAEPMQHDADTVACEHCDSQVSEKLSLSSGTSLSNYIANVVFFATIYNSTITSNNQDSPVLQTHLAMAGPPPLEQTVTTIVLRT